MADVSGVYYILNTQNNKIYIGKAQRVYERLKQHRAFLAEGTHFNKPMQADWDKQRDNSFEFGLLSEDTVLVPCEILELHYIALYKALDPRYGYNIVSFKRGFTHDAHKEWRETGIRRQNIGNFRRYLNWRDQKKPA